MDTGASDTSLPTVLARSESKDNATRIAAIPDLGQHIDAPTARRRLKEIMTDDKVVTMRVDAAEQLVRHGGQSGLLAILDELGRRQDDPDVTQPICSASSTISANFPCSRKPQRSKPTGSPKKPGLDSTTCASSCRNSWQRDPVVGELTPSS